MLQDPVEDEERITECPWNHDRMEACELIAREVIVGNTVPHAKVLGVWTGVQSAYGRGESQPIGRGHFAAAPTLSQWDTRLLIDQPGVGANHGAGPNVVLPYPCQSTRSQGGDVVAHQRLESDVTSFGDQCSTDAQW